MSIFFFSIKWVFATDRSRLDRRDPSAFWPTGLPQWVISCCYRTAKRTKPFSSYHLALGLFHLRDWTFWEHSSEAGWPYGGLNVYQKYLESRCQYFGYIRDLANAVKHAELDPNKGKPSTEMVGLVNTEVSFAAFQSGAFQSNAFQTRTVINSQTSPTDRVELPCERICPSVTDSNACPFSATYPNPPLLPASLQALPGFSI
jgi:hypothetical protein